MAFFWSAVVLIALCIGANSAADAAIRDVITHWPKCTYLGDDNFREDLKLEFRLKLFSHDSLKDELASLKYDCDLEDWAALMVRYPVSREGAPRDGQGRIFLTTFTRPVGSESEGEVMDMTASSMKDAVGKKGSTSKFGCNWLCVCFL